MAFRVRLLGWLWEFTQRDTLVTLTPKSWAKSWWVLLKWRRVVERNAAKLVALFILCTRQIVQFIGALFGFFG